MQTEMQLVEVSSCATTMMKKVKCKTMGKDYSHSKSTEGRNNHVMSHGNWFGQTQISTNNTAYLGITHVYKINHSHHCMFFSINNLYMR